ncbi:MAG: glycosyltransferase family 9 protein [Chlamydiota bacterium]
MKFFSKIEDDAPRILVVSTTGLGDTLWATPSIRAIKTTYPKALLVVLTSSLGKSVLSNNPYIDHLLTIEHNCLKQIPSLLKKLRNYRFDTTLVFHLSQRPTLPLCYFAKPSNIIGTEGINKGLDSLLTKKLPKRYQHEILRRLEITKTIGASTEDLSLEVYITQQEKDYAQSIFNSLNITANTPIIALNPGSKDRFKQWAPSAFIELGQKLHHNLGAQILVTGGTEEKQLAHHIAQNIPQAKTVSGLFSVKELAAFFSCLDIFITNDTGPMHLAFATKTKTIALFCPTDPHLCGPLGLSNVIVMQENQSCTPCLNKKCREPFCMLQISPDTILYKVQKLLSIP